MSCGAQPVLAPAGRFADTADVKKLSVVLALFAVATVYYLYQPTARWRGMPAAGDPVQTPADDVAAFREGAATIRPLARYRVTAVVLSRERYRFDTEARFAPVDLALGWGAMSVAGALNELKITQSHRWYHYRWLFEPPLAPAEIAAHSANTHCIPATPELRRELLEVKRHELVTLEGYLVEVTGDDGFRWRSSLTRDDTGGASCELLWVTRLDHHPL
jgi:hypothetical protein